VPDALRTDVFLAADAVRSGLLSRRQLEGDAWRSVMRGVYVHRDVPVTHELRTRAATLLVPEAVVTGRSAAALWDLDLARPEHDVELTLPARSHPVRITGVHVRRATLPEGHVWRRRDMLVTSPEATAARLASVVPTDAAVAAVDQLITAGLVDLRGVRRFAEAARGPGSARARRVAGLADGLAESPQESRLRLLIGRSPLPTPVAQFRIVVDGRFVARVDFAWPEYALALEYDGLWHAETRQFAKDRQRLNRLQAAGWEVIFVTAADLRDPAALIVRIAAALARRPANVQKST
jgi:hypothetical protein